jgi:GNAT superfamily N-acetyltransferase
VRPRREDAGVELAVVDPLGADAQQAMARYFAELDDRFPSGFDPGDAASEGAGALAPPGGVFVVVRLDGRTVGCGGVQRVDADVGEVKRMWIDPAWRGLGLARRLLAELEHHGSVLGYRRMVLDTNATLREAVALYESSGYAAVERYNDNPYAERWFTKDLDPAAGSS